MLTNRTRRDVIFNRVPSKADLDAGDLAVNAADGIAYTKLLTGQVVPIGGRSISGDSGGSSLELPIATDTVLGGVKVGANLTITADGVLSATQGQDGFVLEPATSTRLGGIKVGARLTVLADGTLSADSQSLPIASNTVLGGVRVGSGLQIDGGGLLSTTGSGFVLQPATNIALGGVKVGSGLAVTADGTLSVPNDRVLRAGDTMTGDLGFPGAVQTTYLSKNRSTAAGLVWSEGEQGDMYGLGYMTGGLMRHWSNRGHQMAADAGLYNFQPSQATFNRPLHVTDNGIVQVSGDGRFQALAKTATNFLYAFAGGPSNAEVNFFFNAALNFQLQTNMAMLLEGNSAIRLRVAGSISYLFTPDNATFDRPLVYSRTAEEATPYVGRSAANIEGLRLVQTLDGVAVSVKSLREHLPEAVHDLPQGGVGVCDSTILATLVGAVQELSARVAELEGN